MLLMIIFNGVKCKGRTIVECWFSFTVVIDDLFRYNTLNYNTFFMIFFYFLLKSGTLKMATPICCAIFPNLELHYFCTD